MIKKNENYYIVYYFGVRKSLHIRIIFNGKSSFFGKNTAAPKLDLFIHTY